MHLQEGFFLLFLTKSLGSLNHRIKKIYKENKFDSPYGLRFEHVDANIMIVGGLRGR
jgi:hypothetical protein